MRQIKRFALMTCLIFGTASGSTPPKPPDAEQQLFKAINEEREPTDYHP
jgi:hypothetical protein